MKNFFEKNKEEKTFKYFKKEYRPDVDWKEMLVVFGYLVVAIVIISGYFFFQIYNGAVFEVKETSSTEFKKVDKHKLSDVLEMIEQKKQNTENILLE